MADLTREEMETHVSISAQDRIDGRPWTVYTDDPSMMTVLNRVADGAPRGAGMVYNLQFSQVSFRKARKLTDAQREALSRRAKENFGID